MPKTPQSSLIKTFLKGTVPVQYGNSALQSIKNRSLYVLGYWTPNESQFNTNKKTWEKTHERYFNTIRQKNLQERLIKESNTVIQLPHKNVFLRNIIEINKDKNSDNSTIFPRKFLSLRTNNSQSFKEAWVKISDYEITWINGGMLRKELLRELYFSIAIGTLKLFLDSICPNESNIIMLICALITGFIKGLVKYSSDFLIEKEFSFSTLSEKCIIEILAELTSEIIFIITKLKLDAGTSSGIKGLLKYLYKHLIKKTYILITVREAFLESFKLGMRATSRTFCAELLTNMAYGGIIGSVIGSTISAGAWDIFINQAFA